VKTPRDCAASELVRALRKFGYTVLRQTASHIRLTTQQDGEHYITVPNHNPIKVGTLHGILKDLARIITRALTNYCASWICNCRTGWTRGAGNTPQIASLVPLGGSRGACGEQRRTVATAPFRLVGRVPSRGNAGWLRACPRE